MHMDRPLRYGTTFGLEMALSAEAGERDTVKFLPCVPTVPTRLSEVCQKLRCKQSSSFQQFTTGCWQPSAQVCRGAGAGFEHKSAPFMYSRTRELARKASGFRSRCHGKYKREPLLANSEHELSRPESTED